MTEEQKQALEALRDAGGVAPIEAFDPDVRVGLVRMGMITAGSDRRIRLTEKGRSAIEEK